MPSDWGTTVDEFEQLSAKSVGRRTAIRRGAVITGAALWATPVVKSVAAPLAQEGSPPPGTQTGSITGRVTDASTGDPIAGALVSADTGQSDATDLDGNYELTNVPAGNRTVTASAVGYTTASSNVNVPAGGTATENFSLSPTGSVTAVLSWNATVPDLDLHMSGPDGGSGRFHVYYANSAHDDYVTLDRDDTDGEGPETIRVTISANNGGTYVAGEYRVWIHSFSGEDFDLADAVVRLNDQTTQRGEFEPSGASGDSSQDIWLVVNFDLNSAGAMSNVQAQQTFTTGDQNDEF